MRSKSFISNINTNKKLYLNIFSLSSINIVRFLINIITLPHLIKNYGADQWGEIVIYQIIINYFIWITDWSFNQHSSKLISINDQDLEKQNLIFNKTITAQVILLISSLICINTYGLIFSSFQNIYLYANLIIIGNILHPYWYLNGLEKQYEGAIIQLINKIIFALLIIILISKDSSISDYFLYLGIASLISGSIFSIRILYNYKLKISLENFNSGLELLKLSFNLFIAEIWSTLSNSFISLVISFSVGNFELGIFNIADRIKSIAIQTIHPITHSLFPRMAKKYNKNKIEGNKYFRKLLFYTIFLTVILFSGINLFIYPIVDYFTKEYSQYVISILRILLLVFIFNVLTEQFILNYFIPNNLYKFINGMKILKFIINVLIIFPLINIFSLKGAALAIMICELIGLILIIGKYNVSKRILQSK
tara:strand:+ start:198 stop:1466 length:1269 start_codon:yes stop_codon:yes gene_type:complete